MALCKLHAESIHFFVWTLRGIIKVQVCAVSRIVDDVGNFIALGRFGGFDSHMDLVKCFLLQIWTARATAQGPSIAHN